MTCLLFTGSRYGHRAFEEVANAWVSFCGPPSWVFLGDEPYGLDRQATDWCIKHDYNYTVCVALWSKFKKRAGPLRNVDMGNQAKYSAPTAVAFPIGESRGTRGCMKICRGLGFDVVEVGP